MVRNCSFRSCNGESRSGGSAMLTLWQSLDRAPVPRDDRVGLEQFARIAGLGAGPRMRIAPASFDLPARPHDEPAEYHLLLSKPADAGAADPQSVPKAAWRGGQYRGCGVQQRGRGVFD